MKTYIGVVNSTKIWHPKKFTYKNFQHKNFPIYNNGLTFAIFVLILCTVSNFYSPLLDWKWLPSFPEESLWWCLSRSRSLLVLSCLLPELATFLWAPREDRLWWWWSWRSFRGGVPFLCWWWWWWWWWWRWWWEWRLSFRLFGLLDRSDSLPCRRDSLQCLDRWWSECRNFFWARMELLLLESSLA